MLQPQATNPTEDEVSSRIEHRIYGVGVYPSCKGWFKAFNIQGNPYFFHPEHRIVTGCDMENKRTRRGMMRDLNQLDEISVEEGWDPYIPPDAYYIVNLYCESYDPDGEMLVQMSKMCPQYGLKIIFDHSDDATMSIIYNYQMLWDTVTQCSMHPSTHTLLPLARQTFLSAITFLYNHMILNSAGYDEGMNIKVTIEQLEQILDMYETLSEAASSDETLNSSLLYYLAKINGSLARPRLCKQDVPHIKNWTGYDSHTEVVVPVFSWKLRLLQYIFNIAMFGINNLYRNRVQRVLNHCESPELDRFRQILSEFLTEWTESNLLATLFLGAIIGFLQLPITSLQTDLILASALFSLLSISSGLHHIWQHRPKLNLDIENACKYLHPIQGQKGTNESGIRNAIDGCFLGFFLAIPFVALLWSVLCFAMALAAYTIQNMEKTEKIVLLTLFGLAICVGSVTVIPFRNLGLWLSAEQMISTGSHLHEACLMPIARMLRTSCNMRGFRGKRMEDVESIGDSKQ